MSQTTLNNSLCAISLPMYDLPELREETDYFIRLITEVFSDENVGDALFTQECGYPLLTSKSKMYEILAAPSYGFSDDEFNHKAFIVVHKNSLISTIAELRNTTFAINEPNSNTGMNLPRRLFADVAGGKPFFSDVIYTGSHGAGMQAVLDGLASAASIDSITYSLYVIHRPEITCRLRILAETPVSPTIPFVTATNMETETIARLRTALLQLPTDERFTRVRRHLHISGFKNANASDYTLLKTYAQIAAAKGYPALQ